MFKATYNITRHYVCTISRILKQTLIDNLLPNLILVKNVVNCVLPVSGLPIY
jgi:hypothetical protein